MPQLYRLWTQARSWGDYDLTVESEFLPAIRSLFPEEWPGGSQTLTPDVRFVPEPHGPRGAWAISVRARNLSLGYLDDEDSLVWAGVIRRVVASGFIPTTSSRIYAYEYDGWDGVEFNADMRIALGRPEAALPLNDPPRVPFTMLPRGSITQVTKEDEHFDVLRRFVPPGGYGVLFATLHQKGLQGRAKPHVEVRIDDERIGQLTPQMSQRFLPMIEHLSDRGLVTACWADITGSSVAAEVRIEAIKANEATLAVLDGTPTVVPPLVPEVPDPASYDLTHTYAHMKPLPPLQPPAPHMPPEPPDGSVVRFSKGNGRYVYVAVRRGEHWETTSTGDYGSINERMDWPSLASRVRTFEIASGWAPIHTDEDARVRNHLAVVRFTIVGRYLAAINISDDRSPEGDWYTTVTDDAELDLPFGDYAYWSDILRYGAHVQVVTSWGPLS